MSPAAALTNSYHDARGRSTIPQGLHRSLGGGTISSSMEARRVSGRLLPGEKRAIELR